VDKLKTVLQSKGIILFALIDHSGEAAKVGMKMPPTKLVIFGNPTGGLHQRLGQCNLAAVVLFWLPVEMRLRFDFENVSY
jgi:Domain of unknown function DUF302